MEKVADIFDGLIGQPRAREFLNMAVAGGKLPQTMIFVGPKGVGRKTTAMMLARVLHGSLDTHHPDTFIFSEVLAELRAQEQSSPIKRTTDAVMKFLNLSPIASKIKVAIIDEADSLSEESQNALLKTLEEPLSDSILILISEDEKRLLSTIVSRSVMVRFGPLDNETIKQIIPNVTDDILKMAEGSVGMAKRLLADTSALEEVRAMRQFWAELSKQSTEDKLRWTEAMRERGSAIEFLEVGLRVCRQQWLEQGLVKADNRLEQIQTAIRQVKDNVNSRVAMEALLLGL